MYQWICHMLDVNQMMAIMISIWLTKDCFKFRIRLSFFYHWKIISKGSKAGLEFLLIQTPRFILVEVPGELNKFSEFQSSHNDRKFSMKFDILEHHGEFLECILGHSRLVPGLDLLFQVMLHSHSKLIQLVPSLRINSTSLTLKLEIVKCSYNSDLCQSNSWMLSVAVVQNQVFFQNGSKILNLFQIRTTSSNLRSFALKITRDV